MKRVALLILAIAASCSAAEPAKPNILFILTEDQGAHLGFLGTPGLKTPNMDALARSGVYFRNAFVAYPVCSPSKAAIYTSVPNHMNGLLNNTLNYHQPEGSLTPKRKNNPLYLRSRVHAEYPTLVELLKSTPCRSGHRHFQRPSPPKANSLQS
jgi:N-sulfoglucosamine sulfohydrolase